MRAVLGWLREFARLEASVAELVDRLVETGTEVGEVRRAAEGTIVTRITALAPVPESSKGALLVDLDTGAVPVRVITTARNVAVGDLVPWAPPGTRLPGRPDPLGAREMFGGRYVSPGMICSPAELGVGEDQSGILILDRGRPGQAAGEVVELDVVLDLEITPNRPDCLSQAGIARELAAALREPFREPFPESAPEPGIGVFAEGDAGVSIVIEDPEGCPRFTACILENVVVGPSPWWIQRRLRAIGLRPINNVVDATNYVAHELGQPLHAFDLDRLIELQGGGRPRVVVRRGGPGERLSCLDGVEREIQGDLVVCAGDRPASLGGIIGGTETAVGDFTHRILLEGANWHPGRLRATSRRRAIRTDASTFFEKGLSDTLPPYAVARAAALLGGGTGVPAPRSVDVHSRPLSPIPPIAVTAAFISERLGCEVSAPEVATALRPLGFGVAEAGDVLTVSVPHFRRDVAIREDLVEETGRSLGYSRVPSTLPGRRAPLGLLAAEAPLEDRIRDLCAGAGFDEAITFSFTSRAAAGVIAGASDAPGPLAISNPLSDEWSVLRASLLPGLCQALAGNLNHGLTGVALFEIGRGFWEGSPAATPLGAVTAAADPHLPPLPAEPLLLAVVAHGGDDADVSAGILRHAQALIDRLVAEVGGALQADPAAVAGLHPGRSARLLVDGQKVGVLGELDAEAVAWFQLRGRVAVAEIRVDLIATRAPVAPRYRQPPRFPAVVRDLAVVVGDGEPAGRALAVIRDAGGALLEAVELYDEYRNPDLGAGRKGWTFRVAYRASDRTLTGEDAEAVQDAVAAALRTRCGAQLRS